MTGQQIGHYRILRELGRGGMGVVYEAVHVLLLTHVAIKVLKAPHAYGESDSRRFLDEARALCACSHDGLVRVLDFGQHADSSFYMVMELVNGESLRTRLRRGPLPIIDALSVGMQMAAALAEVHKQHIVHRDLKPENVMLTIDAAGSVRCKLLDFGIAKYLEQDERTSHTGSLLGTPLYMAPEQCAGQPINERADAYAFGLVLFEMLTGELPYETKGLHREAILQLHQRTEPKLLLERLPSAPSAMARLLSKLLMKDPAKRPSMDEVEQQLAALHAICIRGPVQDREEQEQGQQAQRTETNRPHARMPAGKDHVPGGAEKPSDVPPALSRGSAMSRHQPRLAGIGLVLFAGGMVGLTALAQQYAAGRWSVAPRRSEQQHALVADAGSASFDQGVPAVELADMIYFAGGRFSMGSSVAEVDQAQRECQGLIEQCDLRIFERELPQRQVTLSAFYMDRTEVTNEDFVAWLNQGVVDLDVDSDGYVHKDRRPLLDLHPAYSGITYHEKHYAVRPGFARRPVVLVSWFGADEYCRSQGKMLPTEAQWEYAARGGGKFRYPWGEESPRCVGVAIARDQEGRCGDRPRPLPSVGTMAQDRSAQGVMDLAGSVGEWVQDLMHAPYSSCGKCQDPVENRVSTPSEGDYRVVRGASITESAVGSRAALRSRWLAARGATALGFRCVATTAPVHSAP